MSCWAESWLAVPPRYLLVTIVSRLSTSSQLKKKRWSHDEIHTDTWLCDARSHPVVFWLQQRIWRIRRELLSRGSVRDACSMRYASSEKARRILGYEAQIGIEDAIREGCEV
jgi:hypothetical protein